jgi:hypothetical protein
VDHQLRRKKMFIKWQRPTKHSLILTGNLSLKS